MRDSQWKKVLDMTHKLAGYRAAWLLGHGMPVSAVPEDSKKVTTHLYFQPEQKKIVEEIVNHRDWFQQIGEAITHVMGNEAQIVVKFVNEQWCITEVQGEDGQVTTQRP